jgi:protein-S-isoprenylcysteine O-methyltransferase Ste14
MLGFYTPSFFGAIAFTLCFYGWAAFELIVNLRLWRRGSQNRDRFSRYLIIGGVLVGFTLSILAAHFLPMLDITGLRPQVFYTGILLMVTGLIFRWVAIRQLGAFFVPEVVIQPGQRVYQGGLYRHLRHPSYTGTLITVIGYGLALTNWLSLLIMLTVFFKVYLVRMLVEEAALVEAFGEDYRSYMRRTKRIIPFLF